MQKQPNPVIRISITEVIKWPSPACREVAFRLVDKEFDSRQEALDYIRVATDAKMFYSLFN